MNDLKQSVREYWEKNPNAAAIAGGHDSHTRKFYEVVAAHRYRVEPCIPEMAEFNRWKAKRVLEVGCGMGTDLRQFAAGGARVVGLDLTWQGIQMAKAAFELFQLTGDFVVADAEALPFKDDAFDLVYSNGVIHHTPNTAAAVHEIHRVLHTGGQARVMVYHRNSYFARVIVGLILSPVLRTLLWFFPHGKLPPFWRHRLPRGVQDMHKILADRGFSKDLLFSISTDPSRPGEANFNPLARAYSRSEATTLFSSFQPVQTYIRQLYYADFLPPRLHDWTQRRFGWFLFIRAQK
jgi:SAM-dependent methyltransferase